MHFLSHSTERILENIFVPNLYSKDDDNVP